MLIPKRSGHLRAAFRRPVAGQRNLPRLCEVPCLPDLEYPMRLPLSRGPITSYLFERLIRPAHEIDPLPVSPVDAPLHDDDLQLALFVCYELHYQGIDGVDESWEWNPSLLAARAKLERCFEEGLARAVPRPPAVPATSLRRALIELVTAADDGPSLSSFIQREADLGQFREFVTHRSIYHLKEADPHTWAIPRLRGGPKAALVEIQADEYGGGRAERMHSELFRATMRGLELDDSYGAHLDRVPAITLAVSNVMSLFGLHRRWRGALLGHLAALEMTSSLPNMKYGRGLRRLGGDAAATRFYDEHVQADAAHEQIAVHDMCGGFAIANPSLTGDILYGAACATTVERLFAEHVISRWRGGASSLVRGGRPGHAGASGSLGALKPVTLCEPSQKGLVDDRPQRHSATVALPGSMGRPS
ncbi:iron-containing redox enzyme family protein [Sphaerisporangium sp. NPDC088356]|uniref:iron-containing redox enzyme family protein n=1 Tax=Sphaerisporangium sp. NPDC088356 TaxID=3154871 RepID=UPI00342FD344